jgi:hypothetical protein
MGGDSANERCGLTIYYKGQTIVGVAVRNIGTDAVELRSWMFSKAVVTLDSIDVMAVN